MKERYLSKTPNVTLIYLSKCNIKLFWKFQKKVFVNRSNEHPTTNEGDKERLEIERQKKVDSLEENKYNLSSQIRNWETKLESLEERQSENIEESAELKKSRKDHELKKAKMEVCIKEMRAASSSARGSRLAIFDPLAPKIAARIEEAFRCITCKNNFIHFF